MYKKVLGEEEAVRLVLGPVPARENQGFDWCIILSGSPYRLSVGKGGGVCGRDPGLWVQNWLICTKILQGRVRLRERNGTKGDGQQVQNAGMGGGMVVVGDVDM